MFSPFSRWGKLSTCKVWNLPLTVLDTGELEINFSLAVSPCMGA